MDRDKVPDTARVPQLGTVSDVIRRGKVPDTDFVLDFFGFAFKQADFQIAL
ncbi:MAG: hypothetical protein LBK25_00840 [Treponema sp.]|nr:hypothetical protein [Treponema sp.]